MNKNAFVFQLPSKEQDPNCIYKKIMLSEVDRLFGELTIAGFDEPYKTKMGNFIRGLQEAQPGSIVTVGTAKNHDINWIERPAYALEKGYAPIYDLLKDWATIKVKLAEYVKANFPPITMGGYFGENQKLTEVTVTRVGKYLKLDGYAYGKPFTTMLNVA